MRSGSSKLARLIPAAFLAFCALGACGSLVRVPGLAPVPPEALGGSFTPAEIAADLEYLFALLEEVHPDPYRDVSRESIGERRAALLAGLDRSITRCELQPRLAELVAALGDGHTSVHPPEEFWRDAGGAGSCFPIDVRWDGSALWVRRTAVGTPDGALGPGARLLEIGGRSAEDLVHTFLARQSGESEAWRTAGVEVNFPTHLWLEGIQPPFRVRVACALDKSNVFEMDLSGMPWGSVARGEAPASGEEWRLERRADGVAVLTLDTLARNPGDFEEFLKSTFTALASEPPPALVIDLRRNGGGDSRLGDELLQYLSDRPWRQAARKEWKVSAPMKRNLKLHLPAWIRWLPLQYVHPMGRKIWGTPEGEVATFEWERVDPREEPLRYRGPLAWLIGPLTFSSAMGLAAGAQDCRRGLLVGSETGGIANGFGEVLPFRLPNTQLGLQVSTASFVRSDGDRSLRGGIRPGLPVADSGGGEDLVLEAAITALRDPAEPIP
jgi:hypothetical protein